MNEQNEQSRRKLEQQTKWQLSHMEELEEHAWVALATTTHLTAEGEPEQTFMLLMQYGRYITLDPHSVSLLISWLVKLPH